MPFREARGKLVLVFNTLFMTRLSEGQKGEITFQDSYLREFDTALLSMHPAERAGYLETAYVETMRGRFGADFLRQMATLLLKWSNEKRSFANHARKLQEMADGAEDPAAWEREQGLADSDIRDLRGDSHSLVNKVLSSPPGPMPDVEQ